MAEKNFNLQNLILNKTIIVRSINVYQLPNINGENNNVQLNANLGLKTLLYNKEQKRLVIKCNYNVSSLTAPVDISMDLLIFIGLKEELPTQEIPVENFVNNDVIMMELDQKIVMLNSLININLPLISKIFQQNKKPRTTTPPDE